MTELTSLAILIPLAGALLVGALPRSEPALARALGWLAAMVELGVLAALVLGFDPAGPAVQRELVVPWLPAYGVALTLGVDGRALAWLVVVALVVPLAMSTGGRPRPGEPPLIVGLLGLQAAWVLVLLARDIVTFAAAWELGVVMLVILVGERGDGDLGLPGRSLAARRLAARLLPGAAALIGVVVLLGVSHAHATGGVWRWDFDALAGVVLPRATQQLGFALLMITVVTTLALAPLHGGLVATCVTGPTPVVAVLLGAGMPMALFVLDRVGFGPFALAAGEWAEPIAALAVVGAVYAALVCWAEREPGRLLAHAALAHVALAVVAVVSGSAGALIALGPYLVAHGLALVALTSVAHALRRDGITNLAELAGLASVAPRKLALGLLAVLALAGIPGTVGFVGRLGALIGIIGEGDVELIRPATWALLATGAGALASLGLLRALWHAGRGSPQPGLAQQVAQLDARELAVGVVAVGLTVALGLAPAGLVRRTEPAARAQVEALHYGRCMALELGDSPRPRARADLRDDRGAVCLDPVAVLRLTYSAGSHPAHAPEPAATAGDPPSSANTADPEATP